MKNIHNYYKFNTEKYKELLDGHSVMWLAKKVGYRQETLYLVLNGHKECRKALAIAIVKTIDKDKNVLDYFYEI